jgi:hypothetical protein
VRVSIDSDLTFVRDCDAVEMMTEPVRRRIR